ncbi:gluconate 2-dehydrogenase subunit 3 family protein [Neptunicella sp. SCSIO 80796]|uniref:gluconate 2-dehydrogenase subunit 3 family protein n=1 Tax=Neptunicella plasticusilytica TaxID=3117012 RepID=UPI003A4E20AD
MVQNKSQATGDNGSQYQYQAGMTRRQSLKCMGILAAGAMLPLVGGCVAVDEHAVKADVGHWPNLDLPVIDARGYGKDPNLILPPESPWPLTLTAEQLNLVAVLSDILVPRDGAIPSASEVKVPDVVDEWVSAPYARQQRDRLTILSALVWIDDEAQIRFNQAFVALNESQRLAIIDDIAYENEQTPQQFKRIAAAFGRFRRLVLAAFYSTPQGIKDIGYVGNVPIAGDYPGPTPQAYAHLDRVLADLGLTEYAYQRDI